MSTVDIQPLTKIDVEAMRTCDRVLIRTAKGASEIVCIKAQGRPQPWNREERHYITVDHVIHDYERPTTAMEKDYVCKTSAHADCHENVFPTLARFVRAGDFLRIKWIAHNNNPILNQSQVPLHQDQVFVVVIREKKNGVRDKYCFMIESNVYENNSARMIQRV